MDAVGIEALSLVFRRIGEMFSRKLEVVLMPVWRALCVQHGADFRRIGGKQTRVRVLQNGMQYGREHAAYMSVTMRVTMTRRFLRDLSRERLAVELVPSCERFVIEFMNDKLWSIRMRGRTVIGNFQESEFIAERLWHAIMRADVEADREEAKK